MGNRSRHKSARVRETRSAGQDLRIAVNRIVEQFSNGTGNDLQDEEWLDPIAQSRGPAWPGKLVPSCEASRRYLVTN